MDRSRRLWLMVRLCRFAGTHSSWHTFSNSNTDSTKSTHNAWKLVCMVFLNVYLYYLRKTILFTVSLYFDKAASDLSPANSMQLDDIKLMFRDSSFNAVFIKGYADNDGSDEYNLEPSQNGWGGGAVLF